MLHLVENDLDGNGCGSAVGSAVCGGISPVAGRTKIEIGIGDGHGVRAWARLAGFWGLHMHADDLRSASTRHRLSAEKLSGREVPSSLCFDV